MKVNLGMKKIAVVAVLALAVMQGASAYDPVTDVTARQRWPFSRLVDVSFTLGAVADAMDVELAIVNGSSTVIVPESAIMGKMRDLGEGVHSLVVDPTVCGIDAEILTQAKFVVTAREVPLYMIVDLRKSIGDAERITYLTKSQIRTGAHGSYVEGNDVDWISNCSLAEKFVWTGVTNNPAYWTTNMVFRRIPAGSLSVNGSTTANVFLKKPVYVGVFEFTCGQKSLLDSTSDTVGTEWNPRKCHVNGSYATYRGATNANAATTVDWPVTGYDRVGGYALTLRNRTGLKIDLLTAAQWQYAYRAGTTTDYYLGGDNGTSVNGTNNVVGTIGRYKYNGGWSFYNGTFSWRWNDNGAKTDPGVAFAPVGSYRSNAFGIYDMAGNADEYVLDYFIAYGDDSAGSRTGTDPVGPTPEQSENRQRIVMGGSAWSTSGDLKATSYQKKNQNENDSRFGTRYAVIVGHE